MKITSVIEGYLQIDHERGVIYFHASESSQKDGYCPTPLRICGLGNIEFPLNDRQIDLTIKPLTIQNFQSRDTNQLINEVKVIK